MSDLQIIFILELMTLNPVLKSQNMIQEILVFFCLMAYQLFLGYLMPKPFS